jgi:hypothetical protein
MQASTSVIILYFSILLHCNVQWGLQVMLPSACSFIVLVFTVLHLVSLFTLHVSAYMAIFRCVGCFVFVFLKESASLILLARGYTLHVSICGVG